MASSDSASAAVTKPSERSSGTPSAAQSRTLPMRVHGTWNTVPIDPLPGAREFLDELRSQMQVIIISDTFTQFASPLMEKLGWPTIFCNELDMTADGRIAGIRMRCPESKFTTVRALQSCGFDTIAAGDSFNDLGMIRASKAGFLFRSTDAIKADNPDLPAFEEFGDLLAASKQAAA